MPKVSSNHLKDIERLKFSIGHNDKEDDSSVYNIP